MTHEQVCTLVESLGGKRYPNRLTTGACFEFPRLEGVPDCDCNDRPPSLHVECYLDVGDYPGGVQAKVFGQAGGRWLTATIYSIRRDELEAALPVLGRVAAAVWVAFVGAVRS